MSGNCVVLAILLFTMVASAQEMHIGTISFFGQEGVDITAIRNALPIHEGSAYPTANADRDAWKPVRDAVMKAIEKAPTDIQALCCNQGNILSLYIGLPGKSSHPVAYNPAPTGSARLPAAFVKLDKDVDEGSLKAVQEGRGGEDDSAGYAFFKNPDVRKMQLQVHDFALKNEKLIYMVLAASSDPEHRSDADGQNCPTGCDSWRAWVGSERGPIPLRFTQTQQLC
jgi:hypothetical protein